MAHGYAVRIYSFSLQYPSLLFPGKSQTTSDPAPEGLDIQPLINSINPLNWLKVGRRLQREAPDLIIARFWLPFMGPCMGSILRLARRNGKTRTLAITDNVIPHERRPGDGLFTRYFLKAVEGFIVMSRSVGDDISRFVPDKPMRYVPHPIYDNYGQPVPREQALARLQLPAEPRYLLFFGFIRAYKGLDLLLRAMALPEVRELGIKLIVAGEFYGDPQPYRAMVSEAGIEEQVLFRDAYIPNEDVPYYFGAADLVVQPYKSATQSGISQMAFHFGKPMAVTRVGGLPEIVRHGKEGYVTDISPQAIAEAIVDFFQNNRREAMEAAVAEGRARFSWDNMVAGIESLTEQLAEGIPNQSTL